MVQLENEWDELLRDEFTQDYYLRLRAILRREYSTRVIYPDMHDIFNALKWTSYNNVKVVIIGQDPYHGEGQAHGLAFSVRQGIDIPPSLLNMYKELQNEYGLYIPNNGYLEKWARQGVLLLNTVLTVRAGAANSHRGMGWEQFTDRVIELLNEREKPVIFLLWGANAAAKEKLVTNSRHRIFKTSHPSPLSAYRGFFGCGHFKMANNALLAMGEEPIDWQIENI